MMLSAAGTGESMPRFGAASARSCQISSVTKGMIGCSSLNSESSV